MVNVRELLQGSMHEVVNFSITGDGIKESFGIAGSSIIIIVKEDGTLAVSSTTLDEAFVIQPESLRFVIDSFYNIEGIDLTQYEKLAFNTLNDNSAMKLMILTMGSERLKAITGDESFDPKSLNVKVIVNGIAVNYVQFDDLVATLAHDTMQQVFDRIKFTDVRTLINLRARSYLQDKANAVIERMADLSDQLSNMSLYLEGDDK